MQPFRDIAPASVGVSHLYPPKNMGMGLSFMLGFVRASALSRAAVLKHVHSSFLILQCVAVSLSCGSVLRHEIVLISPSVAGQAI